MARTYEYIGEVENLVPFTLDGPRVVEAGDTIRVGDDDTSFDEHPLWRAAGDTPAATPEPDPEPEQDPISDPEQPESQEPTA
jgi:hypothetical protein